MRKIAIVSKNKALSRLIELEAMSCGASVRSLTAMPRDVSAFSVIFLDTDTVTSQITGKEENIFTVSADGNQGAPKSLGYPPSLKELRDVIIGAAETGREYGTSIDAREKSVIYLDRSQSTAVIDGERYPLSEYELKVLEYLCERAGNPVSREELTELLGACAGNICDVYICRLRKKLELGGERKVIYTVRGKGYMTKYVIV